jgi:anthranilate phosphoribosyltransferase
VGAFAAVGAWPGVLASLVAGHDLDPEVATGALERILAGEATDAQIAGFLIGLRSKGESPEEVAGLVDAMLAAAAPLELDDPDATVDIVGTGGSKALGGRAFNVSTMASIVAAAAGATVCKHGNRRASSTSGSTDLLEALGVEVDLDGLGVHACVREAKSEVPQRRPEGDPSRQRLPICRATGCRVSGRSLGRRHWRRNARLFSRS